MTENEGRGSEENMGRRGTETRDWLVGKVRGINGGEVRAVGLGV